MASGPPEGKYYTTDLEKWSGRRDSNPRPRPWQGRALPLSYARSKLGATCRPLRRGRDYSYLETHCKALRARRGDFFLDPKGLSPLKKPLPTLAGRHI